MADTLAGRGYRIVSGGTDNHLFLVNLTDKGLTGKDAEAALGRANITTNKNGVPFDQESPFVTSGIRIGTAAITARGFREAEAEQVAGWIGDVLANADSEEVIERVKGQVADLTARFPIYDY
jgi:glycine hydroxymethyltransferase